jgi:hypothetical protein
MKKGKGFLSIIVFFSFVFIICVCKQSTKKLLNDEYASRRNFKRDLDREEIHSLSNKSVNQTFCKNPTINEFPDDFSPFKNSTSYFRKYYM